jgi:beta-mannosidase
MKIPLSGTSWQFFQLAANESPIAAREGWLPATVPGVTHLDLLANEKIADPFYRDNETAVQWVGQSDWVYRRTFNLPAQILAEQSLELVCDGLDTIATVYLNGQQIGTADNMFHQHRFNIRAAARAGDNELYIHFQSPERIATERQAKFGLLPATEDDRRVWLRKAQCHFGWDWGPRLLTSGIWRDIRIESASHASIDNIRAVVPYADPDQAIVEVSIQLRRHKKPAADGKFHLDLAGAALELHILLSHETSAFETQRQIFVSAMDTTAKVRFEVTDPKLWWPAGYGRSELYKLSVILLHEGQVIDVQSHEIGLRTIKLIQEFDDPANPDKQVKDAIGRKGVPRSFVFSVNGMRIFCRGANWIPADALLPRVTPETYDALLDRAAETHMNMLRVWGGGIYEDDAFYAACDRRGILVWQDFMFACGHYPEEPWFLEQVKIEAAAAIKRLQNHPCIALWCGNNENHQAFHDRWFRLKKPFSKQWGESIYHQVLPEVCARLDPSRPYWPGSPFSPSSSDPLFALDGDVHRWDVWSHYAPVENYRDDDSRFMSEFGFQALPTYATTLAFISPQDRAFASPIMIHHNKQVDGTDRLRKYAAQLFDVPPDADLHAWTYVTQIVQARAVQQGVDHWRSQKPHCSGALFWQHNDCWPVVSWSCVDYFNRPKALHYYARRFFAPIRTLLIPRGDNLHASLANDTRDAIGGILTWTLYDTTGQSLWSLDKSVDIEPNGILHLPPITAFDKVDPLRTFYHLTFERAGDFPATEAFHFGTADKLLRLPTPQLALAIMDDPDHESTALLSIEAQTLTRDLYLYVDDPALAEKIEFPENFLTLRANSTFAMPVSLPDGITVDALRRNLKFRTTHPGVPG